MSIEINRYRNLHVVSSIGTALSAVWTILLRWLLIQVDVDFYPDVVSDSCQFCHRARSTDLSIFAQGLKLLWF